jgi:hypothetical protein
MGRIVHFGKDVAGNPVFLEGLPLLISGDLGGLEYIGRLWADNAAMGVGGVPEAFALRSGMPGR